MTEETKKPRRKRRTKAQIEADKAAAAELAAKEAEMESQGYEKVRMRDEHGHFVKDDPNTPENEAWEWRKKEDNGRFSDPSSFAEEKEEECIPCKEEAAAALEAAEAALEKELETDATLEEVAKEETVVSAPPSAPKGEYIPMTGLAKLRNRLAQRQRRDDSAKR